MTTQRTFADLKAFFTSKPNATQAEFAEWLSKPPDNEPPKSPEPPRYVTDFARQQKIDLAQVTPEHPEDGLCLIDVAEWARSSGDMDMWYQAMKAQVDWNDAGFAKRYPDLGQGAPVTVGPISPMARNPLVDSVRAERQARGQASGPPVAAPTLFASGDLPAFTASGVSVNTLLQVPWQARHAMAAAPTVAEAYEILNTCQGDDAADTAGMFYGSHPGNQEYRDRVEQWRVQSMSDAELSREGTAAAREELDRRVLAQPMSDDDESMIASLVERGV